MRNRRQPLDAVRIHNPIVRKVVRSLPAEEIVWKVTELTEAELASSRERHRQRLQAILVWLFVGIAAAALLLIVLRGLGVLWLSVDTGRVISRILLGSSLSAGILKMVFRRS